ncbi:hypothetical protein PROFUN_00618 [Planoprotostelium fungivorum]|uniref:Uncharacterized protein n=1 Tax=Planoprotostelium fungivorum TaxID=1890364 RepID=A0A2P6NTV7_9EUKA|nr:hypothetical protein PROFUN_00618 [Planoprotostelium fungivorum]
MPELLSCEQLLPLCFKISRLIDRCAILHRESHVPPSQIEGTLRKVVEATTRVTVLYCVSI